MVQPILTVLMERLDCLVAVMNTKELLKSALIMHGELFLHILIILVHTSLRLFATLLAILHQVCNICYQIKSDMLFYIGVVSYTSAYFGEGSGPILPIAYCSAVQNLFDCNFYSDGVLRYGYGHDYDLGVKCEGATPDIVSV